MLHDLLAFPVLSTERLELVELEPKHAADMFGLFTDARVTAYYHVVPLQDEQDMLRVIALFRTRYEGRQGIRWGILLKGSSELIGTIGFNSFMPMHKASVVYVLRPVHWGRGYASEALKEVLRFGFEQLQLKRIEAEVMPGNTPSEQILEKNGFTREGLLRQWGTWEGKLYDMVMYAILDTEFK